MPKIASTVLGCLDAVTQTAPFSSRSEGLTLERAYQVAAELRVLREARGERRVGRKLGFTNKRLWPEFRIDAPIWGDLFDTTVTETGERWQFAAAGATEPKIEPEIALGLGRNPEPGMSAASLLGCVDWVAHGIEIVQSIYPGWRFRAEDTVVSGALHSAYFLGPRRRLSDANRGDWLTALSRFSLTLSCNGDEIGRGQAGDVLGGPVPALSHLVELLAWDPNNPQLLPGEFVTTGSVTLACDISAGQVWQTAPEGVDLPPLEIEII